MHNIKLIIAYDGTAFKGWQKTKMGPSIEDSLQLTLEQILQHPIALQAASRTDAGVHALGQVINFFSTKKLDLDKLKISLNSLLPKEIVILSVEEMPPHFHPTLDVSKKEYRYYLCYGETQLPHYRHYSWHYPYQLNIPEMKKGSSILHGSHDFSSFCNMKKHSNYKHFVRNIETIEIQTLENERLCVRVVGDNFLYKMVRNLVGTLVYIGRGKIQSQDLPLILKENDRTKAGVTAPAHGLFLHTIYYELLGVR